MTCNKTVLSAAWALLLGAMLAGCVKQDSLVDEKFGESVRYTIALQTADANRDGPPLDGVKAEESIRNYRTFRKIDPPEQQAFTISSNQRQQ